MSFWRENYRIDRVAYEEVVINNCYRLTEFKPNDVVIDIGGHIGAFCYAALDRGAKRIVTVEADRRNYTKLCENLGARKDTEAVVMPFYFACWRSDMHATALSMTRFNPDDGNANTGAGTVAATGEDPDGHKVDTASLDEVINYALVTTTVVPAPTRIAFLKVDCEGAEFPILYTSKKLHLVDVIAMELHPDLDFRPEARVNGFENSLEGMTGFLKTQGFTVEVDAAIAHRPYVWAKR